MRISIKERARSAAYFHSYYRIPTLSGIQTYEPLNGVKHDTNDLIRGNSCEEYCQVHKSSEIPTIFWH